VTARAILPASALTTGATVAVACVTAVTAARVATTTGTTVNSSATLSATGATRWVTLRGSALRTRRGRAEVAAPSATTAIARATLHANVPTGTQVVATLGVAQEEDVKEAVEVVMTGAATEMAMVEAAQSATSATGLVILLVSAVRRRIDVTSATGPDTLPGSACKRRTPATTATRWDTS